MKRLLSVLLSLVLLCAMVVPACAASQPSAPQAVTPLIVVSGFGTVPLYLHANTENAEKVFAPPTKKIVSAVKQIALPLLRVAVDRNWDRFSDKLAPAVMQVFEVCRCDENGESIYDVDVRKFPLTADHYPDFYLSDYRDEMALVRTALDTLGAENTYFFSYDWRLDPMDHAQDLRETVEYVRQQTGAAKVSLAGCSMGGTVVMAYLSQFGGADIEVCLLDNSAFQGISMVGEMFRKDFETDVHCVAEYSVQFMNAGNTTKRTLAWVLKHSLAAKGLVNFAQELLDETKEKICADVLYPLFGQFPGMWAFVSEKDYAAAKAAALDPDRHAALIEKIDRYHLSVQCRAREILEQAMADGCIVEITANYGKYGVPLTSSRYVCNDYLIDTSLSAGGAVCSDNGKLLPDGYVSPSTCPDHDHISPDRRIDAGSCMFPEYTWFVRDMGHLDYPYGSEGARFLMWLLTAKTQPTVYTDARYPQFMCYDKKKMTLTPMA